MIKIEKVNVIGWGPAIRGMRNPLNSWNMGDSIYDTSECFNLLQLGDSDADLMMRLRNAGPEHRKFMRMLVVYMDITSPLYWWKEFDTYKVGTVANSCSTMHTIHKKPFILDDFSHDKLINYEVNFDKLDALFLNNDSETKRGGVQLLEIIIEVLNFYRMRYNKTRDKTYWWQMIQLLPTSYNQKRTVMLNYEVLATMYKQRKNHKLDEWRYFCEFMNSLPYHELITGTEEDHDREDSNEGV